MEGTDRNDILREERHREIVDLVNREGKVLVRNLSGRFAISQVTIDKILRRFTTGVCSIARTAGPSRFGLGRS